MPEGPEVFRRAKFLHSRIVNQSISTASGDWAPDVQDALPATITQVHSHGKALFIQLDNGKSFEVHFGLNGSIRLRPELAEDDYGVRLNLCSGPGQILIRLIDERSMGYIKTVESNQLLELCPDVCIADEKDILQALVSVSKKRSVIGTVLMDQKVLAGIGNYLRAEILYDSKLSPKRKTNTLSDQERTRLVHSISMICKGFRDKTLSKKVYNKKVDPHGNPVTKEKVSSRWMYWVPKLQT